MTDQSNETNSTDQVDVFIDDVVTLLLKIASTDKDELYTQEWLNVFRHVQDVFEPQPIATTSVAASVGVLENLLSQQSTNKAL